MEPHAALGLFLFIMLAIVIFMSYRDRKNKESIEKAIRRVGGEPIEISFKFVGYDRDNQHYNVEFTDDLGRKHKTRCKVNIWTSRLFWRQTPAELLSDLPVDNERWSQLEADPGSAKEQLIDNLVAENERLREQLWRAEQASADLKSAR